MAAFRHMFLMVLNPDPAEYGEDISRRLVAAKGATARGEGDDGTGLESPPPELPFLEFSEGFLTVYRMMLGDFSRSWFTSDDWYLQACAEIFFVVFMLIVQIMMLNVLIAVVSESYDIAHVKAHDLYHRSRLNLAAELDAMGLTREGLHGLYWVSGWLLRILARDLETGSEEDSIDFEVQRAEDIERRTKLIVAESEIRIQESQENMRKDFERRFEAHGDKLDRVEALLQTVLKRLEGTTMHLPEKEFYTVPL
eukprot:gnl/TRDRNA2_/TRDRNA2_130900_c1_seq1.p1 gnl/TRDRNA2_/TRDRNA2_130900_c1~~gnl/TRDRNA2_/TRDRNA2_130900_c1_seq1.p1  ORF type:complete len:269 (-),score=33.39 gnl/TRDRNA2_/TRDRNA2_130900_c1_seq1:310-1068(-)